MRMINGWVRVDTRMKKVKWKFRMTWTVESWKGNGCMADKICTVVKYKSEFFVNGVYCYSLVNTFFSIWLNTYDVFGYSYTPWRSLVTAVYKTVIFTVLKLCFWLIDWLDWFDCKLCKYWFHHGLQQSAMQFAAITTCTDNVFICQHVKRYFIIIHVISKLLYHNIERVI